MFYKLCVTVYTNLLTNGDFSFKVILTEADFLSFMQYTKTKRISKMESEKNITIYDIAQATNLSIATISRIINKKGRYSAETESRVIKAMEELGYTPSASAQSLASNQTHTIGLVLPFWSIQQPNDEFTIQFLSGATIAANHLKYDLLLDNRSFVPSASTSQIIKRRRVDGFIFSAVGNSYQHFMEELITSGFPTIYTGVQLPFDKDGCNVYGGHEIYKQDFLEICYQKGYRNTALFTSYMQAQELQMVEISRQIVEDFRLKKGLSQDQCRFVMYDYYNPKSFQYALEELLTQKNPVEAIYLDQFPTCSHAYSIISSMGLRIPEDIAVVATSQYSRGGEEFSPKLTTTYVHSYEMGYRAVELLVNKIEKKGLEFEHDIPYSFLYRESFLPLEQGQE